MAMIEFRQVSKSYSNGRKAIDNVSFKLRPAELTFLTGPSGAGKSTLLKLILLTERATEGQVLANQIDLTQLRGSAIAKYRRSIGIVFQDYHLLFDNNVFDNVALPLIISGCSARDVSRRVRAALDKVGLLDKEKHMPMQLSGGEQQRIGIARAVVNKPKILLADEPTGNLDPTLSAEIMDVFLQFCQVGTTVLIASHDTQLIERYQHRLLYLQEGKLL